MRNLRLSAKNAVAAVVVAAMLSIGGASLSGAFDGPDSSNATVQAMKADAGGTGGGNAGLGMAGSGCVC